MFEKQQKIIWLFAKYLFYRVQDAMILRSASALSYTTLLAVVPFVAIFLSVFTAFPIFDSMRLQVQEFLIQYFMPSAIENVENYLTLFIEAVGRLTSIGILGIAATAVLMLSTIESSFNFIFQVKKSRKIMAKAKLYGFIIVICPLLLGTALSIKGYLFTLKYFNPENFFGYNIFARTVLPNLLTFGFLMLCYVAIPNKKVLKMHAFYGALMAFVMMVLLRFGFSYFLLYNVTYKTIYGALATIPVLLVWMYLWWSVVLSGAILTAALEEFKAKKGIWSKNKLLA